jgi:hypothetical protein
MTIRIQVLIENLEFIRDVGYGADGPGGAGKYEFTQDVLKDLQSPEPPSKPEGNAKGLTVGPAITLDAVEWWRRRAWALGKVEDTMEVFRAFAELEKEVEPLEKLVLAVAGDVDEGIRDWLRE